MDKTLKGHLAAFVTIVIWGTTFISTKVLLRCFAPIEILFLRFAIGYAALWCVAPRRLAVQRRQEWYFAAAGLCGVTLYYLLENIALTYTLASNVGVIISIAPFFTAIFSWLFLQGSRPGIRFLAGFALALAGIALLSFGGTASLRLDPLGDLLAMLAAMVWAAYATLSKKIGGFGYQTIPTTRRIFFYGLAFMAPVLAATGFSVEPRLFAQLQNSANLLFLGLGASALCFVTWNFAVRVLGSVKTSVYIYLVPVITTVTSAAILGETLTAPILCGIGLTLAGLFLSENRRAQKKQVEEVG